MVNWKTNLDNFASVKVFLTDADIDNIIQIVNSVRNPSRSYLLSHGMIVGGLPFKPILREKSNRQGLSDNVFDFNCR